MVSSSPLTARATLLWQLSLLACCVVAPLTFGQRYKKSSAMMHELARLLTPVLGMEHKDWNLGHQRRRHPPPSRYMTELYKSVADTRSGLTLTANPYNAKVVTSVSLANILEGPYHRVSLFFDLSKQLNVSSQIIETELRIYKSRSRLRKQKLRGSSKSHLLEIQVYQIIPSDVQGYSIDNRKRGSDEKYKLLDARRVSTHSYGWEVFFIKSAVVEWLKHPKTNHGLLLIVKNVSGKTIEYGGILKLGGRHSQQYQPIIVIYSNGRKRKSKRVWNLFDEKRKKVNRPLKQSIMTRRRRKRRKLSKRSPDDVAAANQCDRHEMRVDFEQIGWSDWIISPKSYNAFYCKGICKFPLGQNLKPTNHATVQSIVRGLGLMSGVTAPCCVPNNLQSITLLYYDDHGNVVLKQYDDMVAESCGCH